MLDFINILFCKKPKQKILIFCGAGVSAESGLNTFRVTCRVVKIE